MDMNQENNRVLLCGTMAGAPQYSHSAGGQRFYSFPLQVQRLSGSSDVLNIVLRREQLAAVELGEQARLRVKGEVRSFNNRRGEGARPGVLLRPDRAIRKSVETGPHAAA